MNAAVAARVTVNTPPQSPELTALAGPAVSQASPELRSPWQFSLRGLFSLIAAVSMASAAVAVKGKGAILLSIGLATCVANWRGVLEPIQTPQRRKALLRAAWVLLAASLLLPAAKGCGATQIMGWEAAAWCALGQLDVGEIRSLEALSGYALISLCNLANLGLILSFLLAWRLNDRQRDWLVASLGLGATAAWSVSLGEPDQWLVGYYLWCVALLLYLSARRLPFAALVPMSLLALALLAL